MRRTVSGAFGRCTGCFNSLLQQVDSQEDVDRLLSYYTRQEVLFLDAKLGITFRLIQLGIVAFVVGYMFIYKKGYMKFEQAKGAVVTHVSGDAVSVSSGAPGSRYFGIDELTYPGLENGNIFIATRQTIHRQMRGVCEDEAIPCLADADCTPGGGGVCGDMGLCKEHSWCNVDPEPEKYDMESDKIQIWARSFIQYVKLAPEKLFTTELDNPGPQADNTFTVRQLLLQCEPIPVNYEEVAELGGVFEVQFTWNCNVGKDRCQPQTGVRRLDTLLDPDHIGYSFKYAEYVDADHRVQNTVKGLRFFFKTTGLGKKVSMSAAITTGSMSAALLSFAIVIADLLLTKIFANRNRYKARKFENSPDFSEYMEQFEAKVANMVQVSHIDAAEQKVKDEEAAWIIQFQEEG